ncbi:LuxR C-terminal-related transcriptional regulator [Nocardioides marinisabuli]|uniref:LuxR C-terminal-related transcriptional regulator n=1 Tax=Nocardioides marinisabuli TaxID=419476 RepID=UPI003B846C8D
MASPRRSSPSVGVSPHTVRDHLKNVFRKTGTTSRTELVSHLFSQWYAERLFHH